MLKLRFDDLTALKMRVGEPFSEYGESVTITQAMIDRFAELTHDQQWIHIDRERAQRESPFGTTIAHGFFVLSLLPKLALRKDLGIVGHGNITNYGADRLRFLSPVPAESTVHARARIVAAEAKPRGTLVSEEIEVAIVGKEDKPALVYTMLKLYQPKPEARS
jgi:acyl dehydratase